MTTQKETQIRIHPEALKLIKKKGNVITIYLEQRPSGLG